MIYSADMFSCRKHVSGPLKISFLHDIMNLQTTIREETWI